MPFELSATFRDFYGPGTSTTVPLPASWPQLVRAAATVGRDVPWTTAGINPIYLRYERAWRIAMMQSCLRESPHRQSARVTRTDVYMTLDPSEKGAVSFFLGQATAKYVAEVMFGCIIFAHLDSARRHCGLPSVGRRPDFIGLCSDGRILVVEAKGRSGSLGGVLEQAKLQFASVTSGDLTYAHASFFRGSELRVGMLDPEPGVREGIPMRGILLAYYDPLRRMIADGVERFIADRPYRITSFDGLDVELGLPVQLLDELRALDERDLTAENVIERLQQRAPVDIVEDVVIQGSTPRDERLRTVLDQDSREIVRRVEGAAGSRPTRRPPMRRLQPDPELVRIADRATTMGGVVGSDESYVRLGDGWGPEQMRLDPADRSPAR